MAKIFVDIEIDQLTNSIENVVLGDIFDTQVIRHFSSDIRQIKKNEWKFKWQEQLKLSDAITLEDKSAAEQVRLNTQLNDKDKCTIMNSIDTTLIRQKFQTFFEHNIQSAK